MLSDEQILETFDFMYSLGQKECLLQELRKIEQAARREALSGVEAICADAMDANEALNEIRALITKEQP